MQLFSEKAKNLFQEVFSTTFGTYFRNLSLSFLIFVGGGVTGAIIIAYGLNPRVSASEMRIGTLEKNFGAAYDELKEEIDDLQDGDIERKVQIEMLILYQIPSELRDTLRQEAEKRVSVDEQLQSK